MEIIQYKQVVSSWTTHIIVCIHGSLWKPCEYTDYYHMKQWRRLMSPHRFASIAQGFVIWEHCHYPLSLCCVVLSSIVQIHYYTLCHALPLQMYVTHTDYTNWSTDTTDIHCTHIHHSIPHPYKAKQQSYTSLYTGRSHFVNAEWFQRWHYDFVCLLFVPKTM